MIRWYQQMREECASLTCTTCWWPLPAWPDRCSASATSTTPTCNTYTTIMERNELKGKQTPGSWFITDGPKYGAHGIQKVESANGRHGTVICQREVYPDGSDEYKANLSLIAEAGTVANESGLWPREMQERIKMLEEALQEVNDFMKLDEEQGVDCFSLRGRHVAREALGITTPSTIN